MLDSPAQPARPPANARRLADTSEGRRLTACALVQVLHAQVRGRRLAASTRAHEISQVVAVKFELIAKQAHLGSLRLKLVVFVERSQPCLRARVDPASSRGGPRLAYANKAAQCAAR